MDNSIRLNKLNITAELLFETIIHLKHEFVLKVDFAPKNSLGFFDLDINFDLPPSAIISGFKICSDDFKVTSNIKKTGEYKPQAGNDMISFSIKQISDSTYKMGIKNMPKIPKNITVTIFSTAILYEKPKTLISLPSNSTPGISTLSLNIPLYSNRILQKDTHSPQAIADVTIRVEVPYDGHIHRLYSSTHDFLISNINRDDKNIISLTSNAKSGNTFELCIDKIDASNNRGYIFDDGYNGYNCIYYIYPQITKISEFQNIVFILDSGLASKSDSVAKFALIECIKSLPKNCRYWIVDGCGELIISNSKPNQDTNSIRILEKTIQKYNRVGFEPNNFSNSIQKIGASTALLITARDTFFGDISFDNCLEKINNDYDGAFSLSILSTGQALYDKYYQTLTTKYNGIFGHMHRGHNFSEFAQGLLSQIISSSIKNLSISEFAAGTYYMVPTTMKNYKTGNPIVITLRSKTEYPTEFLIKADGGFEQIIQIDDIVIQKIDSTYGVAANHSFARLSTNEIYRLLDNDDISPTSAIKLKNKAAEIASELNVLTPETICFAEMAIKKDLYSCPIDTSNSQHVSLSLKYLYADEFDTSVTVFGDSRSIPMLLTYIKMAARKLVILCRKNGSITSPNQINQADTLLETAYAVTALSEAKRTGVLDNKNEYAAIIEKGIEYITETQKKDINSIPIVYDSADLTTYNMATQNGDVKRISQFILTLVNKVIPTKN